jgi:hydrogenase-4 component F
MEIIITILFITLGAGVVACRINSHRDQILRIPVITSGIVFLLSIPVLITLVKDGAFSFFGDNFVIDSLSMFHIILVNITFLMASIYAVDYFERRIKTENLTLKYLRRYNMLWQVFQAVLIVVLLSNNIGLMWVALEATTLVSAFLIISDSNPLSIEAMWKYLIVCSVGIVFAFMGTVLTIAAARNIVTLDSNYLFTQLIEHPELIDPKLMLLAFILIVVGFGTKAGLAPMHTWLPDAHSQAPTPVSAVFSGVMLNCALFCILRYLPITEAVLGDDGQAHSIILVFGFMSLIISAVFIPIQHDIKRLLAYCSVEHIGIIAIGIGLGGFGTFAALLHTANHSLSKVLAFFAAGQLGDKYGTRDMRKIMGAVRQSPWWGTTFFISILVLIGVAPFAIFMSDLFILKEAFFTRRYVIAGLLLFCTLAIFISMLKHTLGISFGEEKYPVGDEGKVRLIDKGIIVFCIFILLLLGLWIPSPFSEFLKNAASIVENGVRL